jgi:membrane protease YdiL (CAAX protease family)
VTIVTKPREAPLVQFALFWVLACAISWSLYAFFAHGGHEPESLGAPLTSPALLVAKFGPSLAGLLILAGSGKDARRSFVGALLRTGGALPLSLALLLPFILSAAALAIAAVYSAQPVMALLPGFSVMSALAWIGLRTFAGGGLGEEPGIRGVALPLLLDRVGPRTAGLMIGLAWAIWHTPVLVTKPPPIWLAQGVLTISVSLILTFAWLKTGRSLPFAILFHGGLNGWAAFASAAWSPDVAALTVWQVARLCLLLLLALALLPLDWSKRERSQSGSKGDESCSEMA